MILSEQITGVLASFSKISLEEMDSVKLMDRTDTKYVFSSVLLPHLLADLNGSYRILEIDGVRAFSYHTTYLDTPGYLFFNQHVTGKLARHKVRFRKYETSGISFLEVKKKTNRNRTIKWRIPDDLAPDGTYSAAAAEFIGKHVPYRPLDLKTVLISTFTRITFTGTGVRERVTIDSDISYSGTEGKAAGLPSIAVLEVKKESFCERSRITDILKASAIYPAGFSKYCIGNALLNEQLRTNSLKPALLMIKKIKNEHH
ncbi:MAG: polyphosphate polymerase domain-containing protein [Bacteroidota bacterium]